MKAVFHGLNEKPLSLVVNGMNIEEVEHFVCLEVNIYPDGPDLSEVKMPLAVALQKFFGKKYIYTGNLKLTTKIKLSKSYV